MPGYVLDSTIGATYSCVNGVWSTKPRCSGNLNSSLLSLSGRKMLVRFSRWSMFVLYASELHFHCYWNTIYWPEKHLGIITGQQCYIRELFHRLYLCQWICKHGWQSECYMFEHWVMVSISKLCSEHKWNHYYNHIGSNDNNSLAEYWISLYNRYINIHNRKWLLQ